jgi:predicted permease
MPGESPFRRYRRFWGADPQRDVDEEIAFHLAMREEELQRAGLSPTDAREATMHRFGDVTHIRDECRELGRQRVARRRRALFWDALLQDVRFGLRTLAAHRGFAVVIALTMALGIGANSAVFSVAYGLLLRPLPFHDADALARLWSRNAPRGIEFFSVSPADYAQWRTQSRAFAAMASFERQHDATLLRGQSAEPQTVQVAAVEPTLFGLLGAPAFRGRALTADDARSGTAAALISHELWTTRFGSDSTLIGGTLRLDDATYTVVGVMPPRFSVPGSAAQIWTPLSLAGAPEDHGNRYLRVLGRLAPGATIERARLEMDVIAARLSAEHPETNKTWSVNIVAVPEMIVGTQFRRAVLALVGVVAFVLLIACANAANLQLARAAGRRREIAVRAALGATSARITGQLLVESIILGIIAALGGLALAYGGLAVLRAVGSETVPRLEDVRLDAPVLAFTAVLALGSALLFGLLPAWRASRSDVNEVLKEGGRDSRGVIGRGMRSVLVVAEVSLSLMLLIGAALLMRSFAGLQAVDVGFIAKDLSVVPLQLPATTYAEPERAARLFDALLERVSALPSVQSAAMVSSAPFAGNNPGMVYVPVDHPVARDQAPDADYRVITPGYLRTMNIRLVRGRDFTPQDGPAAPPVVLVSETMARRAWPNEDPVGRRIRTGGAVTGPEYTVVGVVGDARYQSLDTETRAMAYFSAAARPQRAMMLVVRSRDSTSLGAALRTSIRVLDSRLASPSIVKMDELLATALSTQRFALVLFGIFAVLALVLSAVGIYGVMSYLVRQRTHELGIRVALGAPARRLVGLVVGGVLRVTLIGVAIGLLGAWALTRSLATLLFGVSATDPLTFVAIAALLTLVAVVASALPARRASQADPMLALRGEA